MHLILFDFFNCPFILLFMDYILCALFLRMQWIVLQNSLNFP